MWPVTHTEITTASPEAIWALWENVPGWIQWDEGLEAISLDGPFAVGTPGKIRPTGGPSWPFTLIDVEDGVRFTDETRLPLCRLRFAHELESTADGHTAVTITVSFHGPLRPLFQRVIGKDIARELAAQTQRLVQVAEATAHTAAAPGAATPTSASATLQA